VLKAVQLLSNIAYRYWFCLGVADPTDVWEVQVLLVCRE